MRTTLLVLLLLAGAASASESVWRWTDSDGVTHYSDRPVPGATKVELRSINQMSTAGPAPPGSTAASPSAPAAADKYRAFEITAPAPEQVIINTVGQVSVSLRLDPALLPGHSVSVLLDGKPVPGSPGAALQYALRDVPRGEHTVTATIIDPSNQPIASAPSVRFYVRQTIAKNQITPRTPRPDIPNLPSPPNRPNEPNQPNQPNRPNMPPPPMR